MERIKHIITVLLATIMIVLVASCSGGKRPNPNSNNTQNPLYNPTTTDTCTVATQVGENNAGDVPQTTDKPQKLDYVFDEAEVRQRLNGQMAFHVAEFTLTIDAEKEKDFFEDFKPGQRQILMPVKANFKYLFYLEEIGEINCDENGVIRFKLPPLHLQIESCYIVWDSIVDNRTLVRKLFPFTADEKTRMRNDAARCMTETAKKQVIYQKQAADKAEDVLKTIFHSLKHDNIIVYKTYDNRDIVDDVDIPKLK